MLFKDRTIVYLLKIKKKKKGKRKMLWSQYEKEKGEKEEKEEEDEEEEEDKKKKKQYFHPYSLSQTISNPLSISTLPSINISSSTNHEGKRIFSFEDDSDSHIINCLEDQQNIVNEQHICLKCDFKSTCKKDFDKHLTSLKHQDECFVSAKDAKKNDGKFHCICGKKYTYHSGFSNHKKKCLCLFKTRMKQKKTIEQNEKTKNELEQQTLLKSLMNNYQTLLFDNQFFKQQLIEMTSKPSPNSIVNSNNHTTVNSHNKQFNLNFFLNETCKNAMNMSEFIDSLVIKSEELEDMGKLGYVQGISNILVRGLKELDEVDRPMHCTDKKRETLYIKENNVWEKEKDVKTRMKKIIQAISNKNFKHIAQWKLENPSSLDIHSKKHVEYMKILCEVMTSISPDDEHGFHKITRNISQHIYIDRIK